MARITLLVALCLLGVASASFSLKPRHLLPKSLQVKPDYPGTCSANEQSKTKSCLDSYFATYGFDTSKGLPEFVDYMEKTGSVVKQYGVMGYDVYCDFERTLEACLGGLMTSPCMNPDGFVKMYGIDIVVAIDYATTYPVEAYTCQNIDLSKKYFSCMGDISKDNFQVRIMNKL
ncbi:hypothetical protein PENTCL1PPCAC_14342 [Pristionchus entomophagus]|uniref:Uncharacterized protein n=1 Tax=Pristionchus entomophagus TaxID=358040 RepID=A0AAV5TB60_9BILA|nr:hypothetical protein PENTCL1PPCAC_14342 [Pristionchus entomophagus]